MGSANPTGSGRLGATELESGEPARTHPDRARRPCGRRIGMMGAIRKRGSCSSLPAGAGHAMIRGLGHSHSHGNRAHGAARADGRRGIFGAARWRLSSPCFLFSFPPRARCIFWSQSRFFLTYHLSPIHLSPVRCVIEETPWPAGLHLPFPFGPVARAARPSHRRGRCF